jgi:AraC-like DNA-binding protein
LLPKIVSSAIEKGSSFYFPTDSYNSDTFKNDILIDDCRIKFPAKSTNRFACEEMYTKMVALIMIGNTSRNNVYSFGYADFIGWPIVDAEVIARIEAQCLMHKFDIKRFMYSSDQLVEDCCKYLSEHLSASITAHSLTQIFATNHNTLNQKFNKEFRQSPMNWLRARRMEAAAVLLSQTRLSIGAIAAENGYERAENFSTAFKRHHGITPRQFRKSEGLKESPDSLTGRNGHFVDNQPMAVEPADSTRENNGMANPAAVLGAIGTGVKTFKEVADVYKDLNPPQTGHVTVLNTTDGIVTVRSYNNNDWAMLVASAQIVLKPNASAMITASSDPIKLVWKRGEYGAATPFGTQHLSQSAAPKDKETVFVIGSDNTM